MYKGFTESSSEGFVAKEFDKLAPAPGIDWSGSLETWMDQARQNGWNVKTSVTDVKLGSIVLFDQSNKIIVGIVRDINDTGIRFDTLEHNQVQQKMVNYQSVNEYKIIGYIWPERTIPRMKLIIK
ncbi:hypothetical protein [Sporomusa sp. KB1]|uniref:hypothetical protein n=1 Tax=Sporomusa sp. KB1 TaxID=943346 RepID=UPI0011A21CAE|nr:hypothetical protein [Sporomusa sp. KB1]